jgi:hypothetical protein
MSFECNTFKIPNLAHAISVLGFLFDHIKSSLLKVLESFYDHVRSLLLRVWGTVVHSQFTKKPIDNPSNEDEPLPNFIKRKHPRKGEKKKQGAKI